MARTSIIVGEGTAIQFVPDAQTAALSQNRP